MTTECCSYDCFPSGAYRTFSNLPIDGCKEGMIALITADLVESKAVACLVEERKPSTNQFQLMPSDLDGPFFIDMASSAVAAGKINLALLEGIISLKVGL